MQREGRTISKKIVKWAKVKNGGVFRTRWLYYMTTCCLNSMCFLCCDGGDFYLDERSLVSPVFSLSNSPQS